MSLKISTIIFIRISNNYKALILEWNTAVSTCSRKEQKPPYPCVLVRLTGTLREGRDGEDTEWPFFRISVKSQQAHAWRQALCLRRCVFLALSLKNCFYIPAHVHRVGVLCTCLYGMAFLAGNMDNLTSLVRIACPCDCTAKQYWYNCIYLHSLCATRTRSRILYQHECRFASLRLVGH